MAGDGGGNARAELAKFLIAEGFIGAGGGLIDDFGERFFEFLALQADRRCFDGKCLRAKEFHLESVAFKFLGDAGKNDHLLGLQLDQHRHEQALALDLLHLPVAEDLLKKHSFVCNMLVDDPETILTGGQDERITELAQGLECGKVVEIDGCPFGFNLGGSCGGV